MPNGRYTVLGDDARPEGEESFRSAPGPVGWRYAAEMSGAYPGAVDVAVDASWNLVRLLFRSPAGELLLHATGGTLVGRRNDEELRFASGPERHVDVFSPVTNLVTTKRLADTADIDVLYVDREGLEVSFTRQRYERHGDERVETPVGMFTATRWTFTALDSGWSSDLWIAGDVVVRYDRLFELVEYSAGSTGPRPDVS
jgi:hypothetical protein